MDPIRTEAAPRLLGAVGSDLATSADLTAMAGACGALRCQVADGVAIGVIGGSVAARDGRIAAAIGSPAPATPGMPSAETPADALLSAYERAGVRGLEAMTGAFAAVVADAGTGWAWLATDRFGRYPLVTAARNGGLVFASDSRSVCRHPAVTAPIEPHALLDYVFFHLVPAPRSVHAGLERLPAAHALQWHRGNAALGAYWLPDFREDGQDAPAAVLDAVRSAVAREAGGGRTGAFLSGGLDSSTVAGCLAAHQPGAPTVSMGFRAEGYDEIPYARIAARHFGNEPHEYYLEPDELPDLIPRIAAAFDEPFGNSSALPAFVCARLAREAGVAVLLAGDGGDELFAGNARYAKQQQFAPYTRLPRWLRRGFLDPVAARLPQRPALLSKIRRYVDRANTPLPDRLQAHNFLVEHAAREIFSPALLAAADERDPFRLMREIYERPVSGTELKRMLYLDWQQTLADNDLRKVRTACELAGMPVRFPMLDDGLAELAARTPSDALLRGGRLRAFYKEGVDGFLPPAIIDKRKHGFGLPFGIWMREHPRLRELVGDSLTDLARRPYFRPDFIHDVLRLHDSGHAAYYGELAWILMVLELWLQAEQRDRKGAA